MYQKKEKKSTREGINEGKIKSHFFLFLTNLTDKSLSKIIIVTTYLVNIDYQIVEWMTIIL